MSLSRSMTTTDVITAVSSNCTYKKKKKNSIATSFIDHSGNYVSLEEMALTVVMTLCPWHWTTVLCYDCLHIYYQQICFLSLIYPSILSLWISECSQHDALHFFHCFHLGSQVFTNLENYPLLFKYSPFLTNFIFDLVIIYIINDLSLLVHLFSVQLTWFHSIM